MDLTTYTLMLSAIVFTIGGIGVLIRRNPLIMFMSIELMLNSVNLAFASFARQLNNPEGQIFVFLVIVVAAAEAVVGLAIIISIFRSRRSVDVDELDLMRG